MTCWAAGARVWFMGVWPVHGAGWTLSVSHSTTRNQQHAAVIGNGWDDRSRDGQSKY